MKFRFILTIALSAAFALPSMAQQVIVPPGVNLPKDTVAKAQLLQALNGFIAKKDLPYAENNFILKEDVSAAALLLDELRGIEKNPRLKDDNFYKPYLANVTAQSDDVFAIQLNYMGIADGAPVLRLSCRLMAKKASGAFYIYSPLVQNTRYWKVKKLGNITFHYKDTLNTAGAKFFEKTVAYYDNKLKVPAMPNDDYYCDNLTEALQITGIDYKLDYNGLSHDNLAVHENNMQLIVNGWNSPGHRFDTHDLWHERLRMVVKTETINRPVDEGCAYLYGGSWLVYSWTDIITGFKKYADANPNADWLTLYINEKNKNFLDGQKPLKISYAINALIVQKVEKEKGFTPVMELLTCGKIEKGDENYFKALEKVSGITKANFNSEVWQLIRAEY